MARAEFERFTSIRHGASHLSHHLRAMLVATERMPVMLLDRLITLSSSELRESPAALGLRIKHRYAAESANGKTPLASRLTVAIARAADRVRPTVNPDF